MGRSAPRAGTGYVQVAVVALRGWYSARVYVCTLETCIARDRVLAATVVGVNLRRRIVRASHCYGTTRITEPTTSRAPRRIRRAGGVVVACIDLGPKAASACLTTAQVCEGQAREWVGRAGGRCIRRNRHNLFWPWLMGLQGYIAQPATDYQLLWHRRLWPLGAMKQG